MTPLVLIIIVLVCWMAISMYYIYHLTKEVDQINEALIILLDISKELQALADAISMELDHLYNSIDNENDQED